MLSREMTRFSKNIYFGMLCQVMDCTAFQATRDAHNKKLPVVNQTPALSTLFSEAVEQTYSRSVKS